MVDRSKNLQFLGISVILLVIGIVPIQIPTTSQAFSSCNSPLPFLDQTFFFSSSVVIGSLGPAINVTITNNSSLSLQVYIWAVVHDELGRTVYIGIDNGGEVGCGITSANYVPLVVAKGQYNISVSLTTPSMIQVSTVQTLLATI